MKRLIICCDGTWNTADQARNGEPCPTNVVKIACRIAKRDGMTPQIVYYDQGVGTGNFLDRWTGGAFGHGLEENIHDAYRFLIANYELGDELFLFGFSRGAFTARSLAGMIRNCGILKRTSVAQYRDAIDLYRDPDVPPDDAGSRRFRADNSIAGEGRIPIRFIGVWDTVGSLGIPLRGLRALTRRKHRFHDAELSGSIRTACHALAIDERRSPFEPALWRYKPKEGQTVEQVWFPGVHGNVGGGYRDSALSDVTLQWMVGRAEKAGLAFDAEVLEGMPMHPEPLGKLHESRRGLYYWFTRGIDRLIGFIRSQNEAEEGRHDPTQAVHDSALKRWDGDSDYRPTSLRAYLRQIDDPRSESE